MLGNTPLVRINSLSDALGVEILGKAEVCPLPLHIFPKNWFKFNPRSSSILVEALRIVWLYKVGSTSPMLRSISSHAHTISVIEDAERSGLLQPYTGSRIFEGTVGSTGISIATIARARYVFLLSQLLFRILSRR